MRTKKNKKTLLNLAAAMACPERNDFRAHRLGAVGIRADGQIVHARNGQCTDKAPSAHAEARLARKLTPGSIVFVARPLRSSGMGNAKPCAHCQTALKSVGVTRVYYTTETGFDFLDL